MNIKPIFYVEGIHKSPILATKTRRDMTFTAEEIRKVMQSCENIPTSGTIYDLIILSAIRGYDHVCVDWKKLSQKEIITLKNQGYKVTPIFGNTYLFIFCDINGWTISWYKPTVDFY
jgi:hypothetical protein